MPLFRSGKPFVFLGVSADYAVGTGFATPAWDIISEDPAGQYSGGQVTIERDGQYLVSAGARRSTTTVVQQTQVRVRLNGVVYCSTITAATTAVSPAMCSRYGELAAGDVLEMDVTPGSTVGSSILKDATWFSVVRLGPVRWTG